MAMPGQKKLTPALFVKLVGQTFAKRGGRYREYGQASIPLTMFYPYRTNVQCVVQANAGYMSDRAGSGHLAGLTDIRLSAIGFALDHRLMLAGGINLPTGKSRLDGGQARLQYAMADNDLAFAIKNFGEGFGMNMGAAYAGKAGDNLDYGAGAGYYFKGAYRKHANSDVAYDPGDILTLTSGLDHRRGQQLYRCDVSATVFLSEREDGEPVFRQGAMLMVKAAWHTPWQGGQLQLRLFDLFRARNSATRTATLEVEEFGSAGNRVGTTLYYTRLLRPQVNVNGAFDLSYDRPNGYDRSSVFYKGHRTLAALKAGGAYVLNQDLQLEANVRLHAGNAGGEAITGAELDAGVKYGF
jgi:hypothetical protein